jgi:hypothetical protein
MPDKIIRYGKLGAPTGSKLAAKIWARRVINIYSCPRLREETKKYLKAKRKEARERIGISCPTK